MCIKLEGREEGERKRNRETRRKMLIGRDTNRLDISIKKINSHIWKGKNSESVVFGAFGWKRWKRNHIVQHEEAVLCKGGKMK